MFGNRMIPEVENTKSDTQHICLYKDDLLHFVFRKYALLFIIKNRVLEFEARFVPVLRGLVGMEKGNTYI